MMGKPGRVRASKIGGGVGTRQPVKGLCCMQYEERVCSGCPSFDWKCPLTVGPTHQLQPLWGCQPLHGVLLLLLRTSPGATACSPVHDPVRSQKEDRALEENFGTDTGMDS